MLWVDPDFNSGRLARFTEVPCNTKVDILVRRRGVGRVWAEANRLNFGHPLLNGKA